MDPIDRELASLLSVEPSPEFRARVRARIAVEPLPRPWYLQWRAAEAGAAAAAIVAGVAIMRVGPVPQPTPTAPLVDNGQAAPMRTDDPTPAQTPHDGSVAARRSSSNSPEVVIDRTAARGLQQLDALVREGRVQLVFDDEPGLQEDIVVAPIVIEPITVTTLSEPSGDAEGDRQ